MNQENKIANHKQYPVCRIVVADSILEVDEHFLLGLTDDIQEFSEGVIAYLKAQESQ